MSLVISKQLSPTGICKHLIYPKILLAYVKEIILIAVFFNTCSINLFTSIHFLYHMVPPLMDYWNSIQLDAT